MADADELFAEAEYCRCLAGETDPLTRLSCSNWLRSTKTRGTCSGISAPAHQSESIVEKNEQPHRVARRAGTIEILGGGAVDCTVRTLSKTGAALEIASPVVSQMNDSRACQNMMGSKTVIHDNEAPTKEPTFFSLRDCIPHLTKS